MRILPTRLAERLARLPAMAIRLVPTRPTERLPRIPIFSLVFAVLGVQLTASSLTRPLGFYDEGLLVTDGFLLSRGAIPYRDFYANYPPGSFLVVRACMF